MLRVDSTPSMLAAVHAAEGPVVGTDEQSIVTTPNALAHIELQLERLVATNERLVRTNAKLVERLRKAEATP